jgi:hypothetical protein
MAPMDSHRDPKESSGRSWVVVPATMVVQAFGRFTHAPLLPSIQSDLGISDTAAGRQGSLNLTKDPVNRRWLS